MLLNQIKGSTSGCIRVLRADDRVYDRAEPSSYTTPLTIPLSRRTRIKIFTCVLFSTITAKSS